MTWTLSLQGVEMDWEWPVDTGDKKDKIKLIRYMRGSVFLFVFVFVFVFVTIEELHVAGVGSWTESNLMAHSILSAPFHPFQYPTLLWSVSELGSAHCGKKDGKRSQWRKRQNAVASMCHELRKQVPYISTTNKQPGGRSRVGGSRFLQ